MCAKAKDKYRGGMHNTVLLQHAECDNNNYYLYAGYTVNTYGDTTF
jgi:hypothetical protein